MGTKLSQIKILSKAELYNVFGLNVLRFSKDKRVKRRATLLLAVYCFFGSHDNVLCGQPFLRALPAFLERGRARLSVGRRQFFPFLSGNF